MRVIDLERLLKLRVVVPDCAGGTAANGSVSESTNAAGSTVKSGPAIFMTPFDPPSVMM
jgi:hypothetical protein